MDNKELDKLRILAANGRDFYNAVLTKLRDRAIVNGHDMSEYDTDGWGDAKGLYTLNDIAHCKKCKFQIEVEFMNTASGEKVYFNRVEVEIKCDR